MAKYKYLRGGRVFESDKKYNLPTIGMDGKLVTPTKKTKVGTDPKTEPPVFKTKEEHYNYYKNLLLERAKTEKPNIYGALNEGKLDEASFIAVMGGFPEFKVPVTQTNSGSFNGANSRVRNIGFKPGSTEGYQYNKRQGIPDKESITKRRFDLGGRKKIDPRPNMTPGLFGNTATAGVINNVSADVSTPSSTKSASSFSSLLGSTAPFLDNIANLVATNKTPNIPNPVLTNAPRLATKLNINPQKRRIENDVTAAGMGIDRSTSSAGVANANKGSLLANKFRAIGDLEANKANFEAEQGNRQAYMDFQASSNNNQLINKRNEMQMMRQDDINSRYASVLSDFGSDIANINRENNLMARDKDALRTLMKTNPDAAYQFADTAMFKELFANDEPALRNLILSQKGTAQKAKLSQLYKQIFNRDFTE